MNSETVSLRKLAEVAQNEFSGVLRGDPILMLDRLRLVLVDGSFLDVRYPTNKILLPLAEEDWIGQNQHGRTPSRHLHFP